MKISDHEKQLILLIDEQVQLLRSKGADDLTIINTLIEFTAEARCIMDSIDENEFETYFLHSRDLFVEKFKRLTILSM